jgi:hypothetical protein
MVDVSEAGAGLELPLEKILGGRLVVDLELPTGQAAEFHLVGDIRNMSVTPSGMLRLGIEFAEVGDFERVVLALLQRRSA